MEKFEQFEEKDGLTTDEETFRHYFEDLRLTPEDFKKRILDVGAGGAEFAKWAKEHGIANEIYSLDQREEEITERGKSVAALAEKIPFRDGSFDLVVSIFAIPNIYLDEEGTDIIREKVKDSLNEMIRVLRPGGEIRLAGVLMGEKYKSRWILSQSVNETLSDLEKRDNIQIERIRTPSNDLYKYDKNNNPAKILAKAHLIIIRKMKKQ